MNEISFRIEKTIGEEAVWFSQENEEDCFFFINDLKYLYRKKYQKNKRTELWYKAIDYVLQNHPELLL